MLPGVDAFPGIAVALARTRRPLGAGTGLELSEVSLARDLLDPSRTTVGGPLPPDVQIP